MNNMEERGRESLSTPGYTDRSMYPPPGQLPFEQITAMNERAVDMRVSQHLRGKPLFHSNPYEKQRGPGDELRAARKLEIKRIALALLEGYSIEGKSMQDWYAPMRPDAVDPVKSLHNIMKSHLSREAKDRIKEVRLRVAREAAVFAPNRENQKLLAQINARLVGRSFPELAVSDIVNLENIPAHNAQSIYTRRWEIADVLKIFLFTLDGYSVEEIAMRIGVEPQSLRVLKSIHMSDAAKKILKTYNGRIVPANNSEVRTQNSSTNA